MFLVTEVLVKCAIASKINFTQRCFLAIPKVHSILAEANLRAHNNISQICYCGQILLQGVALNCSFSDNMINTFGGNIYFAGDAYGTVQQRAGSIRSWLWIH